jgi:hypothetical protein
VFSGSFDQVIKKLFWKIGTLENHDLALNNLFLEIQRTHGNPLIRDSQFFGFSQMDEDSILVQIFQRINGDLFPSFGTFVELGVGDGLENNTLSLFLSGWRGYWFGGEDLRIEQNKIFKSRVKFDKLWISLASIDNQVLSEISKENGLDLLSLDLDGNDYHFATRILESGIRPKVWVQEYNAHFGPWAHWIMPYDDLHEWDLSNYFGASITAFNALFRNFGYTLIACNITGVNAFFVQNKYLDYFKDVPTKVDQLYMPYRPWFPKSTNSKSVRITRGVR